MIEKELFVKSIEAIKMQLNEDKVNSQLVSEVFGKSEFNLYDNSKLINQIINLLRFWFPKDKDGFCEIERFCFYADFGKLNDESIEEFFDRLTK